MITGDEKDSYTLEDQDFEYDSNAEDDLSIGDDYYEEDIDEQKDIPVSFYNALVLNEVCEHRNNVLIFMNCEKTITMKILIFFFSNTKKKSKILLKV